MVDAPGPARSDRGSSYSNVGAGRYRRPVRTEVWLDPWQRPWRILVATRRRERLRGFHGKPAPPTRSGLLLTDCRSVHTVGLGFAIDALLLDTRWRVVGVVPMVPGRLLRPRRDVRHVLEVRQGSGIAVGDRFSRTAPAR